MANEKQMAIWKTYQDAWADIAREEREKLLKESVAENCAFVDPDTEDAGLGHLTKHIEDFQQQFPGAYFATRRFFAHHNQSIADWIMYAKDGSEAVAGISHAHYDEAGRLVRLAGFWKL